MEYVFGNDLDINQDLLLNDAIKPLQTLSLLQIIPRCFTRELLIRHAIPIYPEVSSPDHKYLKKYLKYRWDCIEDEVSEIAKGVIEVPVDDEVREVTHFVGSQIFIFLAKHCYPVDTLIYILENLVFTWRGTVNLRATFNMVLQSSIPITEKFEIACKNFLSEEILVQYFFSLGVNTINRYLYEIPKKKNIPIYFWICRFTGFVKIIDCIELQNVTGENQPIYFSNDNSLTTIEYLFYWSISTFNDMAVQYLWERFISHTKERGRILNVIFTTIFGDFRMASSIIYLFSNILERETTIFFDIRSAVTFKYILLELRWQNVFSKVFDALYIWFEDIIYIDLFKFIIKAICSNTKDKFDKRMLKEFLVKMPASARSKILNEHASFLVEVIPKLHVQFDLESCSLLLTMFGPLNHNSVFITNLKLTWFDLLLISGRSAITDHILIYSLKSFAASKDFKSMYFRRRALKIFRILLSIHSWVSLSCFTDWCFTFEPEINIKRKRINALLIENEKLLKQFIFQDRETDDPFNCLDNTLRWCCSGSQIKVTLLKTCLKMAKETDNNENVYRDLEINIYSEIKECVIKFHLKFLRLLFNLKPFYPWEIEELKDSLKNERELYQIIFREKKTLNFFSFFIGLI